MELKTSPFAPSVKRKVYPVRGATFATCHCHIKASGNKDLMLSLLPDGTSVAGVFTQSSTSAAPVDWCRDILQTGKAKALVVHSGNANAFTGRQGEAMVEELAITISNSIGCSEREVYVAATGVIGQQVPKESVLSALDQLYSIQEEASLYDAAETIMTTDTFAKTSSKQILIDGETITISGMSKGSGMIMPDMATMLAFVYTDASISSKNLQLLLSESNDLSFNRITVDSDTSTNDTLLAFATNKSQSVISPGTEAYDIFRAEFSKVVHELALDVVKDGEGISKLIKVTTKGSISSKSARNICFSIANSPLVKTTIVGEDPNWGRIVMAVGKSKEPVDKNNLSVSIGPFILGKNGDPVEVSDLTGLTKYMKNSEIEIEVNVGVGDSTDHVWTSDLTHEYININADYHT